MSDERPRWWISVPLVLIALGGLAFAIYRYSTMPEEKEPEPPPPPAAGKGKGLSGPPPIPMPPGPPTPKGEKSGK